MLTIRDPWNMGTFRSEMDGLFDRFLGASGPGKESRYRPPIEAWESEESLVVRVELPGVEREKVNVKVEGQVLTVSGTKEEKRKEKEKYHIYEVGHGAFQRVLQLPEYADSEKCSADYADGVLEIAFPKKEEAKPKQVQIKVK